VVHTRIVFLDRRYPRPAFSWLHGVVPRFLNIFVCRTPCRSAAKAAARAVD
jgi:hypothetical protein